MDEDKRFSYFFLGLGLGVAVGILFAPKAGDETRDYIKGKADEGRDYLKRRSTQLREQASELVDRSKQTVTRHKDQVAAAVEAGRQAYRESLKNPAAPPAADDFVEGV